MRKVYITGAGVVSPIGLSVPEFFDSLENLVSGIGPLPFEDLDRLRTRVGGKVDTARLIGDLGFERLEPPFLGLSLELVDNPKCAFALSACQQALRDSPREDVTLFTTAGLEKVCATALLDDSDGAPPVCSELPPSFIAEVLCFHFGLAPCPLSFASACASSTQSIGEAFRAVASGRCAAALAGGTDSMLFSFGVNAFNSLGALAEGGFGECFIRPFDEGRNGTILGEGAAFFLLESEERVRARDAVVLCEIMGYASSLDGYHPVKPHPEGEGASDAMSCALADAGIEASSVAYINAHGSGTRHNDLAEARAISRVFSGEQPPVSSTKPYYGHLLTAAGAVELLSLLFAFQRKAVPPNLNLLNPDRQCPVDRLPTRIVPFDGDTAISNSFGLNGQNGVLVLALTGN